MQDAFQQAILDQAMNVEQHAEAILRAAGVICHDDLYRSKAILTAVEAFGVACAEAMREAAQVQAIGYASNDDWLLPASGWDEAFVSAWDIGVSDGCNAAAGSIRALDPAAIVKAMK